MHKRILFASVLLIGSLFAMAVPMAAQASEDAAVTLSPATPAPGDQVTITLNSYSVDLASSNISWSVDGGPIFGGVGAVSHIITAKAIGKSTNVSITINPVGSGLIKKTIVITPMAVDLLWEATDSSVPPLYRGKALPTSESSIKFTAIPTVRSTEGLLASPNSLIYEWQENYTNYQSLSGYGKTSYATEMDYLNPEKHVSVNVLTREGTTVAGSHYDLSPVNPKIVWYASSPLFGPIFDMALSGSYNLTQRDASLYAMPYFFSPGEAVSNELEYTWSINGEDIATPATPNSIFLTRDINANGTAEINLSISSLSKLFQQASSNLTLYLN